MSKEERAMRACAKDVENQFSKPFVIDNDKAAAYLKEQKQLEASLNYHMEKEAAEKRRLIEESNKPMHFEADAFRETLDQMDKQIKANIKAEQASLTLPKNNESYDHLEELYDIDHMQLMEAKAERSRAELLEDSETVEKLNKDIKDLEAQLSFYSEQMAAIEGKDNG